MINLEAVYKNFVGETAKRGIKKYAIAKAANMNPRTLHDKIFGRTDFTLSEAVKIRDTFFPDQTLEELFRREE